MMMIMVVVVMVVILICKEQENFHSFVEPRDRSAPPPQKPVTAL
jgi:hypothetical protein